MKRKVRRVVLGRGWFYKPIKGAVYLFEKREWAAAPGRDVRIPISDRRTDMQSLRGTLILEVEQPPKRRRK